MCLPFHLSFLIALLFFEIVHCTQCLQSVWVHFVVYYYYRHYLDWSGSLMLTMWQRFLSHGYESLMELSTCQFHLDATRMMQCRSILNDTSWYMGEYIKETLRNTF